MKQYLDLCRYVLENGEKREDRTGTGTISVFGYQMRCNLEEGFPLLTTKKVFHRGIFEELLWFLKGETNIRPLALKNVKIWNDWPYAKYKASAEYQGETMEEFIQKICNDEAFAEKWGDLGPVYGKQWRNFDDRGVDQITQLIENLKNDPFSRRHLVVAYNPAQVEDMALPPCHAFFQFYVSADKKKLSCQLYQRSADLFLGVPFNIASYSLLLAMVAQVCGYEPYEFVHTFGDTHIYLDHIDQIKEQLAREPKALPKLWLNPEVKDIFAFTMDDIKVLDYDPWPPIKGKVSV
ncbi:MAG: thymidylate synthase [Erysipelotrichaceae bacterium]|nr:thymidylate synthase [Erysipelotrichaceae bacterium]